MLPRADILGQYIHSSEVAGGLSRTVAIEWKGAQ
jgi:hypothetical protein